MEIPGRIRAEVVETPSVNEVVLFSNTPSFLISQLRKNGATMYVSQVLSTAETIDLLRKLEKPKDVTELTWAYVLLVSLFLRDDLQEFRDKLESLNFSCIQWGNEIRRNILTEMTPTSFHTISYENVGNAPNTATAVGEKREEELVP
jgi:hypothetical protein